MRNEKRLICCQAQRLQTLLQFSVLHRLAVYLWQGGRIAINAFTGGIMCVIDNSGRVMADCPLTIDQRLVR